MAKVTYTKGQLMAFTVKEMKTLDLYSQVDPKGLSKSALVSAMLSAQKAEQKASKKAKPAIKKETKPKTDKATKATVVKKETVKEDKVKEEVVAPKSEKPIFHRPRKGRNPMNFRLK